MKKRMLICGIKMNMGGTEKAFLSFLDTIDRNEYEIDLVLAEKGGTLFKYLPKDIRVFSPIKNGFLFSFSKNNILSVLWRLKILNLKLIFLCLSAPFSLRNYQRLWVYLMNRSVLPFETEFGIKDEYDICLAYWGDRTMFYICDKVKAKIKVAWLHFDYFHPKRDDKIYLEYFNKCNAIVSVSKTCTDLLKNHFPPIKDKFITVFNSLPKYEILNFANEDISFPDNEKNSIKILSVMRICSQKGYPLIPEALFRLKKDGINAKWYIIGSGAKRDLNNLLELSKRFNVEDMLVLLGQIDNPYPYIKNCDLFVLPSKYEGMPITVEEAKLFKKPIVCTNYLSAREQLENGKYGEICEHSADSLYQAIKKELSQI